MKIDRRYYCFGCGEKGDAIDFVAKFYGIGKKKILWPVRMKYDKISVKAYGTEFTNSHYENIKKVYNIWICMNPPKNRENSISFRKICQSSISG